MFVRESYTFVRRQTIFFSKDFFITNFMHLFFLCQLLYIFDCLGKKSERLQQQNAQISNCLLDTMVRLVLWLRGHAGSGKDR